MNIILSKIAIPVLAAIICGFGGYAAGVYQVSNRPIDVKTECPQANLKCPDAVNTIDFDKIKGFKGNINLTQQYHVEMDGDSLIVKKIIDEMNIELAKLRLARCK